MIVAEPGGSAGAAGPAAGGPESLGGAGEEEEGPTYEAALL